MRIGIDARMMGARFGGGIGRYVAELVHHLQLVDKETEYVIFLGKQNFHEFVIREKNFSKKLVDIPWYSVKEQRLLPREILHAGVHAMHYPHWNVPLFSDIPFIVTLHDLMLLEEKEAAQATTKNPFVHAVKFAAFRYVLDHAVHRSRHIVSVSNVTRDSILRHFRISPQKVSTIYPGITPPKKGNVTLADMHVQAPYILALGNMYPHKNGEVLIRALARMRDKYAFLVFAGKYDAFSERLKILAREEGVHDRVRFLHAPRDEEVYTLLAHAALLAHPSLAEGFGMPPLEAALLGTPVAVSDLPIFHETMHRDVQFVDPRDVDGWSAIMTHAVQDPASWKASLASGKRHVKRYNWEETALAMKEVYLLHAVQRM